MNSRVATRARMREDRAGDPLEGMVNLFDLGMVLALAFLLVAISSLKGATSASTSKAATSKQPSNAVTVRPDQQTGTVPPSGGTTVIGNGQEVGKVYRLDDGRLVYVAPKSGG
jgi:hypothetical protein